MLQQLPASPMQDWPPPELEELEDELELDELELDVPELLDIVVPPLELDPPGPELDPPGPELDPAPPEPDELPIPPLLPEPPPPVLLFCEVLHAVVPRSSSMGKPRKRTVMVEIDSRRPADCLRIASTPP